MLLSMVNNIKHWIERKGLHRNYNYAEEKKRADEIQMAEIQAEAEEKKRADKIQAEGKKRAVEIRMQMSKIEADKELTLKEMEPKAQAQESGGAAVDPPHSNRDAKSPKLPAFIDGKDELESYLLHFECFAKC